MSQHPPDDRPTDAEPPRDATLDQIDVRLSSHAVERYQQRVRPALDSEHASSECISAIASGQLQTEPPAWLAPTSQHPAFYIWLGDVAMPADRDSR